MRKILLIEDDPFLVDIYTTGLMKAGYQIEVARDGETGIKKIKEFQPDLLVLDIILPKADGWQILNKLRENQKKDKLKIVILSNLGEKEEIKKGLELGVVKYFVKAEYTPTEIIEEIKKIL